MPGKAKMRQAPKPQVQRRLVTGSLRIILGADVELGVVVVLGGKERDSTRASTTSTTSTASTAKAVERDPGPGAWGPTHPPPDTLI